MDTLKLVDESVLKMFGEEVARERLQRNVTQSNLAKESGVSLRTIKRIESGASTQFVNIIRVLRALDLLGNIELLIPHAPPSPVEKVYRGGKVRARASVKKSEESDASSWAWGDDK